MDDLPAASRSSTCGSGCAGYLVLFLWLTLAACVSPPKSGAPSPGLDGYDDARLQVLVSAGLDVLSAEPCRAAALLGVLDDPSAGTRLDRLIERAATSNVVALCIEPLILARITRLGRIGELDLTAELVSASPVARATALRYAVATRAPEASALLARGIRDDERDVRVVAYRGALVLGDLSLLDELGTVSPEEPVEAFWHCAARAHLDPAVSCPEQSVVLDTIVPGEVEGDDPCAQARAELSSEPGSEQRQHALDFYLGNAFHQRVEALDRLEPPARDEPPCTLDEDLEDGLLASSAAPAGERAVVAAALLWRRHEALGQARAELVQLTDLPLRSNIRRCSAARDCPEQAQCLRSEGRGGFCGNPREPVERGPSIQVWVASNACWSFMDCPAFYSCYYLDPHAAYGVCMRP